MRRYITLSLLLLSLVSCSKIIDVDYESIDKFYVIIAEFSLDDGSLLITQSCDMDEPIASDAITTATVALSDGVESYPLEPDEFGYYRAIGQVDFVEGRDYTISVDIDEEHFSATSHLYAAPQFGEVTFSSQQFTADMNLVFCTFQILDTAGEQNYYLYRLRYEGKENDSWNLAKEDESWSLAKEVIDGEPISLMSHLYTFDRELQDGDVVSIDLKAIDKGVYDFLYTLNLSSSSSTNPTTNFDGGCMGYFSICSTSTYEAVLDFSTF